MASHDAAVAEPRQDETPLFAGTTVPVDWKHCPLCLELGVEGYCTPSLLAHMDANN
jgi:hypothetical protein